MAESKNANFDMEIKNPIITRYCVVSINTFQRVIINNLLEVTNFSTKKVMPDMSKKGPGGKHSNNIPGGGWAVTARPGPEARGLLY